MFNFSPKSSFQPFINVLPSRVIALPQMAGSGSNESRLFPRSPAVVTQCPTELLRLARQMEGSQVRLASLRVGGAHFGITMVQGSGHFAAAFFDFSEENSQEMAKQALKDGELHLLLNHADDFVLLVPKLTAGCCHAFSMAKNVRLATVEEFTRGYRSIEGALRKRETWEQMGVDANSLKSITFSVCVPGLDGASELEIQQTAEVQPVVH